MKIASKVIVYDKDDNILILTRSYTHPRYPLHADFPGGLVEQGEDVIEAARRELEEESGIIVAHSQIEEVYRLNYNVHWLYVMCQTKFTDVRPEVILSWEHSAYEWKPLDELLHETLPYAVDSYYAAALNWLRRAAQKA